MSSALHNPLDRILDPLAKCFTPDVAKQVVELRPDASTQAHIDELASKANHGTLTPAEQAEYEGYVDAIDVVAILQAKARKMLA
jgi:hypothetical protein